MINTRSLAAALGLCFAAAAVQATENPVGAPNGADGFLAGALPPAGTYSLLFGNHYHASSYRGSSGASVLPGFSSTANVIADKVLHMTDAQFLGGQVGLYGAVAYADIKVNLGNGATDKRSGLLDPEGGVIVGWHTPEFHWYGLATVVVPLGSYDKNRIINLSSNYYTFRPQVGFSYLPASGLDVSARFSYIFNTKNNATDYQSGQWLHSDFNVGFKLADGWKLGLQGYYLHQTTDDKQGGAKVGPDGNRVNKLAFGPGLLYQGKSASIEVRYLTESQVKNGSKGNSAWVKAVWAF